MLRIISKLFFEGLIVVIPLYLTYRFIRWALTFFYNFFHISVFLLPEKYREFLPVELIAPVLAAVVLALFVFICGIFVSTIAGRTSKRIIDRIMQNIPIVNTVYSAFNDLLELTVKQSEIKFSRVVYVANPNKNSLSLGFVTGVAIPEITGKTKKRHLNVFIPGTPNPTSGFMICVPEDEVKKCSLDIEKAMKLVVSGGVVNKSNSDKPGK